MKEIVVIGGGAAGLMAAAAAAERGARVRLLEPNERLGKKLNITGKGRCNLTNRTDMDGLMDNIPRNGRFLYSAFSRFTPADVMAFFEAQNVPLKVERGNRVYPASDSAFDISDALRRRLRQLQVPWIRDRVLGLEMADGGISAVCGEKDRYSCQAAILATGGLSYPGTGSTGDGYRMAEEAGHTVSPLRGSLVPLESPDPDCGRMQGLALKNAALTVYDQKNKAVFRDFGEMLFTHFGVSGPMVLSASAHLRHWERDTYRLVIDLKPALDEQKLEARILRDMAQSPNRDFEKIVAGLVHRSMVEVMTRRLDVPQGLKVHDVTKKQRRDLVRLLKHFEIPVSGPRSVAEAIITSGGVKTSEVDPGTMQSKLVSGLYFAGEILDVDAYTGGFNLQIAWSTGHLAGSAAAEE